MADFPTLGLRFDVNEVLGGLSGLTKVRDAYLEVAAAREKAQGAGGGGASGAASGAELQAAQAQIAALNRKLEVIEKVVAAYQQMGAAAAKAEQQTVAAAAAAANETVALSEAANAKRVGAIKAMADQILAAERNLLAGRNEMLSMQVSAFRDITASMISIDRQRVAAAAETEAQINAVKAEANAFALSNFQATTASMIALGRQRETALASQTAAAYGAAERQARLTNTPFSVIATGKTVDPVGDLTKQIQAYTDAGKKIDSYKASLLAARAEELGQSAALSPMIAAITKTGDSLHAAGGQAYTFRELLVSLREVMRGDFSRLGGTLLILGQQLGIITTAVIAFVAVLALIAAPFIAIAAVVAKAQTELANFNNAMKATAGYAGVTFGELLDSSKKLAETTDNTTSSILKTMEAVVASGRVSGAAIADTTEAATRLAELTGQKSEAVAKSLIGMYGDAAEGAAKLNESVHFLTLSQYEQIKAMQDSGDSAGAFSLAVHDLAEHLRTEGTPQLNFFEQGFHDLHTAIDKAIEKLKEFSRDAPAAVKVRQDFGLIATLQQRGDTGSPAYTAALQKLQQDQDAATAADDAAKAKAYQDRVQEDAIASSKKLTSYDVKIKGNEAYIQQQLDDYQASVAKVLAAGPDNGKGAQYDQALEDQAHMQDRLAALRKRLSPSVPKGGNTFGVQNQLARLQAQQAGLFQQALNPATDPISAMLEQIKTAGAQAAGGAEFGKRSAFQEQLADAAQEVERLKLVKQVNTELSKRVETQKVAADEEAASFAAYKEGAAAQSAYYKSGQTSLESQIALQQQLIDIQERAKEKADALKIIQQTVGVTDPTTGAAITTVDQAYSRLLALAGGNKEVADAMRQRLQAAIDTQVGEDRLTASDEKAKAAIDPLVQAQKAYADELKKVADLQKQAGLATADERAAQALVTQEGIYRVIEEAKAHGQILTHAEAEDIERANQLLIVQAQYWANLQIQIKDAMEQTFIDTGKLDFKGLQDGMTKALRKAIYDSLIAKPIDIIVNAEVNVLSQLETQLLQPIGDKLSGVLAPLTFLGGAFNNTTGGYNAAATSAMDAKIAEATSGIGKATSGAIGKLGGFLQTGFQALAYGTIGNSLSGMLGGRQNTGSMVGGLVGSLAGSAFMGTAVGAGLASTLGLAGSVAGPIGMVVGAVLGSLLGGILGGKPSNNATLSTITPTGYTLVPTNKSTSDTEKLADAFSQAVLQSEAVLKAAGVTTKGYISGVDIGVRDQPNVSFSTGEQLRLGAAGDAAATADAAMKHLLEGATYASDAEKKLTESMLAAGNSFDDIAKKLQEFGQAEDFLKGVDRSILKLQDPQAGALADLRDQQIARRQQAITYYQDGVLTADQLTALQTKLKTLEKLEIVQTLQQFSSATVDATATVQEFADAQKKVIDYANGLLVGNLSPLSPMDQLSQAQSSFYSTLALAQKGDSTALGNVTGASDTYLNQAHAVYASSTGYANIFDQVEAALRSLGGQAYPTVGTTATTPDSQAVVAALAQLQDAITQNNADLITAIAPATNDNATGADIANQTQTLVGALQDVQTTIAASTEAITYAVNGQAVTTPLNLNQLLAGGAV